MIMSEYTPFMKIESPLPAPLDLITFRITDINGEYSPIDIPEFTHYYDSIVWSADDFLTHSKWLKTKFLQKR